MSPGPFERPAAVRGEHAEFAGPNRVAKMNRD
jgi:hypothetical protein